MSSIIKRRKTVNYAQIHNTPLQTLEDIRSIGLIAHLMSLPEEWEIRKMQLYSKFGRAAISHGMKELEEKKYMIDIKYRNGKLNEHIYHVSDTPFSDEEVRELIIEVENDFKVMTISKPFEHLLSTVDFQQLKNGKSSIDDFQQLNVNSSSSTIENEHLLNKRDINKTDIKKNNIKETKIDNYQEAITNSIKPDIFKTLLTDASNSFYTQFSIGRWSKKDWNTLIERFVDETIESGRYINIPESKIQGYAFVSLKNMAAHADYKRSEDYQEYQDVMEELSNLPEKEKAPTKFPYYNIFEN